MTSRLHRLPDLIETGDDEMGDGHEVENKSAAGQQQDWPETWVAVPATLRGSVGHA
ncbi:MAG: hypothetical protein HN904_10080 [Victivallales bacterium]|nr:hypothetical protein [Victivallales bacterium]